MDFRKKVNMRIWFSVLLILLGAVSIGIVYFFGLFGTSFRAGFYFGLGAGLIGAGTATIIRNVIYLKNASKFKAAEIADKDERNRFIINRTWSLSAAIMLFLIYMAVIVGGILDITIFFTLLAVLGAFVLVLLIVQIVLKKLY
jgi:hypothetical protein